MKTSGFSSSGIRVGTENRSKADEIRDRFVVGIDLGTTNCALAFVDLDDPARRVEILPIPQAVAPGVCEERPTLPSFFCRASAAPSPFFERRGANADKNGVVGVFARDFGASTPDSFVSSAKSWLCHSGVDRTAKILPWRVADGDAKSRNDEKNDAGVGDKNVASEKSSKTIRRWSPVEISSFYLAHLRAVWNAKFPDFPLETQDVALTIPASFDETARELTIRAAKLAGLTKIALVEEPQAAFYSWLERRRTDDWTAFVRPGDKILVCDVGGGTTDFALIYALKRESTAEKKTRDNEEKSEDSTVASVESGAEDVRFYRVAVGDHLILGGDNLDLALYKFLEQKFVEKRSSPLSAREKAILLRESRETKEFFLRGPAEEISTKTDENEENRRASETRRVALPGVGSKAIGGGIFIDVERRDVEKLLLDGFFPRVPLASVPARRRVGVREIALPFAPDPAITKYLARFLTTRRDAGLEMERAGIFGGSGGNSGDEEKDGRAAENGVDRASPDVVLFNGGAFESPKLRARIVESLVDWFGGPDRKRRPTVLESGDLYLAVARGAAYYGLARRGLGTKIGASLARAYYVGVAVDGSNDETTAKLVGGDSFSPENLAETKNWTPLAKTEKPKKKAVCLLPTRCEPGDEIALSKTFELAVDRPVSFPIFVSSVRATDAPGQLIDVDPNELRELPPIQTALKTRSQAKKDAKTIRARLLARPTEIGTIELFLQEVAPEFLDETRGASEKNAASRRGRLSRWTLQFDVRGATQTDWEENSDEGSGEGVLDEGVVEAARRVLTAAFGSDADLARLNESVENAGNDASKIERMKPGDVFRRLSDAVGASKNDFPITLLRRLAETTLDLEAGRRRSAAVEARWLNWLGFALRPGFGAATDDWRVERAWKTVGGSLAFRASEVRTQYWILWRRVASGLSAGRQLTLAEPLLGNLRDLRRLLVDGRGKGPDLDLASQEGAEIWRLLGALELLPTEMKEEIGAIILDALPKKKVRPVRPALVWALGRLGARIPFNAPLDRVVSGKIAGNWALRLLDDLKNRDEEPTSTDFFALAQSTRRSTEPTFDVEPAVRDAVSAFLTKNGVADSTAKALEVRSRIVDKETTAAFGESLPLGLRWNDATDR